MSHTIAAAIMAAALLAPGIARADAGTQGRTVVVGNVAVQDAGKSPELSRSLGSPLEGMSAEDLNAEVSRALPQAPVYSLPQSPDRRP